MTHWLLRVLASACISVTWLVSSADAQSAPVSREATAPTRIAYAFFKGQPPNGPGAGSRVDLDKVGTPDLVHFTDYAAIVSKALAEKFPLQALLYAWSTMPMEAGVEQQMPTGTDWAVRVTLTRTGGDGATFRLRVSRDGKDMKEVLLTVPNGRCSVVSTGSAGYDSGFVLLAPAGSEFLPARDASGKIVSKQVAAEASFALR